MTVLVRPVDLDSEAADLVAVLERNLSTLPHAKRFEWLYRDNPLQRAASWFAYEGNSGRIVGVASVFPQAMWLGKKVRVCGKVGDFAVDMSHRSLGPALMLQRATFEPVDRGALAMCYDCPPDDLGMATFDRLKLGKTRQMWRFVRLLGTEAVIERRIGVPRFAAALAAVVGDIALHLRPRRTRAVEGLEIALHEGRFGEEFSALDDRVGGGDVIRSRRHAEDLNWRFRDAPLNQYRVMTSRRRGEVVGYLVLEVLERDAFLVDLFCASADVAGELLEAAAETLRLEAVQTIRAVVSDGSPLVPLLTAAAFSPRSEAARVVAYAAPGTETHDALQNGPVWAFTRADVAP